MAQTTAILDIFVIQSGNNFLKTGAPNVFGPLHPVDTLVYRNDKRAQEKLNDMKRDAAHRIKQYGDVLVNNLYSENARKYAQREITALQKTIEILDAAIVKRIEHHPLTI